MTTSYTNKKLIRDGDLVAEVQIELSDDHEEWGPTMSLSDARKVDEVRDAMRRHDYDAVRQIARLYRLVPLDDSPRHDTNAA